MLVVCLLRNPKAGGEMSPPLSVAVQVLRLGLQRLACGPANFVARCPPTSYQPLGFLH